MTDVFDGDEELSNLQSMIASLRTQVDTFKAEVAPLEAEKDAVKHDIEEIKRRANEEMLAKAARAREIDEKMYEAKRAARRLMSEMERHEEKLNALMRAKILANEFATLEQRWDQMTAGAPWREWALDHQLQAGHKITFQRKMILADTMGLGKTLSSILALDLIRAATHEASPEHPYGGEEKQVYDYDLGERVTKIVGGIEHECGHKVLYFCPATMIRNVEREVRRWAPHRSVVVIGKQSKLARNLMLDVMTQHSEYVVICNYEAWRKDKSLIESLISIKFDTMIIDEAHNIKDRKSNAYRGIKRILDESDIPFVLPMTGTPILNRPQELYSLLTLVAPELFYSENYFLQDYCVQDVYTNRWTFKAGGLDRLAQRIAPYFMRRTKEQAGIKLPPKTIVVHDIEVDEELYPNQARARSEMRKWGSIMLDPENGKAVTAAAQIAVYTRLRQIETWPAGIEVKDEDGDVILKVDIEESQKLDEIIRFDRSDDEWTGILPEVVSDERVVVFSQFTKPLIELKRRCDLAGINAALMIGATPDSERNEIMKDFDNSYTASRADAKYDVILANYKVGGVGATYTAATQMIILDEEWNPGKRDQAYDRIHRIGQDKPVTIHVLRDTPSIDTWLANIIEEKEKLVDGFHATADLMAMEAFNALKEGLI